MRILLANFHRLGFGQPTAVFLLARALAERGHQVVVAAPPDSVLLSRAQAAGLQTFAGARFLKHKHVASTIRDVVALRTMMSKERIEIAHGNGSQDTWALAFAARWLSRPPVVVATRHNSKTVHTRMANRWLYATGIRHLILTSAALRAQYHDLLALGTLTDDRISVIPPAFDAEHFTTQAPDSRALSRELGVAPDVPLLGIVGRLDPDKGHDVLLRAMPAIRAVHPHALLVFAGSGNDEGRLRGLCQTLGISQQVRFLGFRSDMQAVTAGLTISILPTRGTDSSPTVIKEALALGVPVIAAQTGGVAEVIDNGNTGRVIPVNDVPALTAAVLAVLADLPSARAGAERGRQQMLQRFSPGRCAQLHLDCYNRLLGNRL